jgi:hypothetical protein
VFLEIVTRHHAGRPGLLARNRASIERQTSADWQQTLLIDDDGRGMPWANAQLSIYAPKLTGEYIWILDDDDYCTYDKLVEDVKFIVDHLAPGVIMIRGEWMDRGLLPSDDHWGQAPTFSNVGICNFIVHRSIWQEHADRFRVPSGADFDFISGVFQAEPTIYWHDVVAFFVPTPKFGAAE